MDSLARTTSRARGAVFAPLGDAGRAERVESRLGEAIVSGVLAEGEKLPSEPELAAMLGVATTTAREALVALRARGLVVTTRGRGGGSFVRRPDLGDGTQDSARLAAMSRVEMRDRGALYQLVTAGAAEMAAERADGSDLTFLRSVPPIGGVDAGAFRRAESEFYLSIAALTHSARITREVVRLEADFGAVLRIPADDAGFRSRATGHHADILAALERRSGDDARRAVRAHVTESLERLAEIHASVRSSSTTARGSYR